MILCGGERPFPSGIFPWHTGDVGPPTRPAVSDDQVRFPSPFMANFFCRSRKRNFPSGLRRLLPVAAPFQALSVRFPVEHPYHAGQGAFPLPPTSRTTFIDS